MRAMNTGPDGDPAQVADNDYNLDIKNPAAQDALAHRSPEELAESILAKEQRIAEIMGKIKVALEVKP